MEVLPVRSGAEAPWRHRRWLPVELAHRRSDRTEILRIVLHAGSLDQLKPADLALRKGHASRDDAPARVLDHQREAPPPPRPPPSHIVLAILNERVGGVSNREPPRRIQRSPGRVVADSGG